MQLHFRIKKKIYTFSKTKLRGETTNDIDLNKYIFKMLV